MKIFILSIDWYPGDDDGDGIPDHLDNDDDGDGIPDEDEGNWYELVYVEIDLIIVGRTLTETKDDNGDCIPDYLDNDADDGVIASQMRM